jgi:hypothetical protein
MAFARRSAHLCFVRSRHNRSANRCGPRIRRDFLRALSHSGMSFRPERLVLSRECRVPFPTRHPRHTRSEHLEHVTSLGGGPARWRQHLRPSPFVLNIQHAEDRTDSVCPRAGDGGEAAAATRRFLHSLECAEPRGLQAELLREQNVLCCLQEKLDPDLAAARQKR